MKNTVSVTELLQALIRIPSVNPEGNPPPEIAGELRCATAVEAFLCSIGASAECVEVLPGRPNVVGHFPSDKPGKPKLLLAPHTDTVTVEGMTVDPFGAVIENNRIYGRGASDTKGSMAAMLWALRGIGADKIATLGHEIWFAGLMGEETGQHGAKHLAQRFQPDFVIAGEPTECKVVHTHKGSVRLHLVTRGRSAHSACPQDGENAINKMMHVLADLQTALDAELNKYEDEILGFSTSSIGKIRGGVRINIVPDYCEAEVDIRTVPSLAAAGFPETFCRELARRHPALQIEHSLSFPLYTDPSHPMVAKLASAGRGLTGAPWFCDAAVFAKAGFPAVAAGPGCIAQAHTEDEYISISDLEDGVAFFREFLLCC